MNLFNSNSQLKSYEKIANEFRMRINNTAFIKYIKLIAAIPTKWLDNLPSLNSFHSFK